MPKVPEDLVIVGAVAGIYGVQGWVRVRSHTDPIENILNFPRWYLQREGGWQAYELLAGRRQGKGLVAGICGVADRDQARALMGVEIAVPRSALPPPQEGEYYWIDLEGLRVVTLQGQDLGRLDHLFATGANDVMVVHGERQRLIPFVLEQVVDRVDFDNGEIRVDWDPEF